jgi:hypothetical protein
MSKPHFNWKPGGAALRTSPGTMRKVAELAIKYKLAGIMFDHYADRLNNTSPAIHTDATAAAEIREVAQTYGFLRSTVAAPVGSTFAAGQWVDVIPLIDPQRDSKWTQQWLGVNKWTKENGTLIYHRDPNPAKHGTIRLPLLTDTGNVEVELDYTYVEGDTRGNPYPGRLNLDLPGDGRGMVPIALDSHGRIASGVVNVNMGNLKHEIGRRYKLLGRIYHARGQDQIEIEIDGQQVARWSGDRTTMMFDGGGVRGGPSRVGLWIFEQAGWKFHSIRMRAIDGSLTPIFPRPPGAGWVNLFNGYDLTGWEVMQTTGTSPQDQSVHTLGSGGWEVHNGALVCKTGIAGWLKTKQQYGDFELQLDFKLPTGGNSGIYIRSPDAGHLSRAGMEVQINDAGRTSGDLTGGIHLAVEAVSYASKPTGQWNHMEIHCQGDDVTVRVNGTLVVQTDVAKNAALKDRPRRGYIGLANWMGQAQNVEFRNIWLRELASASPPITPDPTPADPTPPQLAKDAQLFQGHYYKFFPETLAWHDASKRCADLGGHLVVIESLQENTFVGSLADKGGGPDCWIGITDEAQEKRWVDVAGNPVTYTNWMQNQPNNKGAGEHFALMSKRFGWQWSDQPNVAISAQHQPGYVCEWDSPQGSSASGGGEGWQDLTIADFIAVQPLKGSLDWKDGVLACNGATQNNVVRSRREYENFEFIVQWRALDDMVNAGIFVWTPPEGLANLAPGKTPSAGVELQILAPGFVTDYEQKNNTKADWFTAHGDVLAFGTTAMKPFTPASARGLRSLPKKQLCKPAGQWNEYHVRCENGEVRLSVNGEEVSGGSETNPARGHICLQLSSLPIEFRGMRVRELDGASSASVAPSGGDWIELFNGRDLTGWEEIGTTGGWSVKGDEIIAAGKAVSARQAGWLMTEREFADFELQLEFAIDEKTDSGVAFRCDRTQTTGTSQAEIQVVDQDYIASYKLPFALTGALSGLAADKPVAAMDHGKWHTMTISCVARDLKVSVDNVVTVDTNLDDHVEKARQAGRTGISRAAGPIGLQRLLGNVRYRNIRIRDLGGNKTPVKDAWVDLFNGRDLTGWREFVTSGQWAVAGGVIGTPGGQGGGWLATEKEYSDFELELEYKHPPRGNSGVFLRMPDDTSVPIGGAFLEVQLMTENASAQAIHRAGGVYRVLPAAVADTPPDAWHKLRIRAVGPEITTWINDKQVAAGNVDTATVTGNPIPHLKRRTGRIGLQRHGTQIEFRNIRIKEL